MKTTRRSFLKYLGGLAVSAVAIPSFLKTRKAETILTSQCDLLTDPDSWYIVTDKDNKIKEFIASEPVFKGDMLYIDADGKVSPKGKMIYGSVKNI